MKVRKSSFDLTHERKLTAKADGTLYPIFCEATLPGDSWRINSEILARMTPLVNPVYHRFDIFTHFFFVPNRLVWKNWGEFIFPTTTVQDAVDLPCAYVVPNATNPLTGNYFPVSYLAAGTLGDHLGCSFDSTNQLSVQAQVTISMLPFRAYALIWNEFFRDQDLQKKINVSVEDSFDYETEEDILKLQKKCWEKDYFTTARPWAQKGDASRVSINHGEYPIAPDSVSDVNNGPLGTLYMNATGGLVAANNATPIAGQAQDVAIAGNGEGFTIEDLRHASAVQRFLEKLSRSGSRYIEAIQSFFGVRVKDYRLQRPEFIGGGRQPVVISEVLQTSQSDTTPLGTYGGHGISSGGSGSSYFCPEHGYIIGLMSIMPRAGYVHSMRKEFFKLDKFEFFLPEFAALGDQPIMNIEINGDLTSAFQRATFGYQERFSEYKFIPSTVHGQFKSDAVLKNFVADRNDMEYELNEDFVQVTDQDDTDRIYAISTDTYDPFLVSVLHKVHAIRPVPLHPSQHHVI
ncbi:MAG: major capsid protein [Microvirus sp.]|nr:MAG: major capsid protein [Microvirus sp.]